MCVRDLRSALEPALRLPLFLTSGFGKSSLAGKSSTTFKIYVFFNKQQRNLLKNTKSSSKHFFVDFDTCCGESAILGEIEVSARSLLVWLHSEAVIALQTASNSFAFRGGIPFSRRMGEA